MGFRMRRSIKLLPGVRLNVGKSGITSLTVGRRGGTVTTGKNGTYVNVGIPGTGISYREKISGKIATSDENINTNRNNVDALPISVVIVLIVTFVLCMIFFAACI